VCTRLSQMRVSARLRRGIEAHDEIVRETLEGHRGSEVKHSSDGRQRWIRAVDLRPSAAHSPEYLPKRQGMTTKLDIERHTVTPEAFGWQVVRTADGPDFIGVIDN
jgi:hypothetical protein